MNSDISKTQNALGTVAQWLSADNQVKIVWHKGGEVYADMKSKTLHIPSIAEADTISGEDLWLCRAHVYHEAGHIIETGRQKEDDNAGLHMVFNALEDRRMERILRRRYDGADIAFKKSLNHYNAEIKERMNGKHPAAPFEALIGLSFEVEGLSPSWEYADEAGRIADLIRDDFMQVFSCKTAKECLKLAKVIWDKIKSDDEDKEEEKQEQNQSQNGDGESDSQNRESNGQSNGDQNDEQAKENGSSKSDSQDGESDGQSNGQSNGDQDGEGQDGDGKGQSDGDQDGDGQPDGQNGDGKSDGQDGKDGESKSKSNSKPITIEDNGEKANGQGENQSGESGDGKSLEARMAEAAKEFSRDAIEGAAVKKILNENQLNEKGESPYTCDRTRDQHITLTANDEARKGYKNDLAECNGAAALLARTLEEYLKAITKSKMLHCQRRGKLDPRRFTVLAKGLGKDVFKRMSNHAELDTAIEIIFDESGSMWEYREVRKAIMIISEALNRVGIPFEVTGGTTKGSCTYNTGFTRTNPILYRHYKTFGDNWEAVRGSLQLSNAFNNYIDGEMVEFAARRLIERSEKRKIIFSLSDGCPCGGEGNDYELGRKLIAECDKCRKSGIEVYSFGIRTEEPSKYYGKNFSVVLEDDIGQGLSKGISAVMTKGKIA